MGFFLPGVSEKGKYELFVRVIHEKDQFLQDIPPIDFEMEHSIDPAYGDYWSATINIEAKAKLKSFSAWGTPGKYAYRYCLKTPKKIQSLLTGLSTPLPGNLGLGNYLLSLSGTNTIRGTKMNWNGKPLS